MSRNYYPQQLPLGREINAWISLLVDHARFMRNGFDTTEEQWFAEADNFSRRFVDLGLLNYDNIERRPENVNELQTAVNELIDFKGQVYRGVDNCLILSILPAALIDHIKREAIFFSGILARILNEPRPTWNELGLPGNRVASTPPQAYIPDLRGEITEITWEELLFWMEINYEHANVLSLYFRPEQGALRRETLHQGRRMQRLYKNILNAYRNSRNCPDIFIQPTRMLINDWKAFLDNLYADILNCSIPGNQMNIWPRVLDHMIREADYFLQILAILAGIYKLS